MSKRSAVLCAAGFGDALLMMIAVHRLQKKGDVTLFHPNPSLIAPLFPHVAIQPYPPLSSFFATFSPFDLLILENDHSERAWHFFEARSRGAYQQLRVFFPTPSSRALPTDFVFRSDRPIAYSIALALDTLLNESGADLSNGLPLTRHPAHSKRVILHPTSNDPKRNWKKKQFLRLAAELAKRGYEPHFSVGPHERGDWEGIPFPLFSGNTLLDLAHFLQNATALIGNDSGVGHLASNLGIPTLTISASPKRVAIWRPSWARGVVVTPPVELPNFKGIGLRLREHFWHYLIPVNKVLRAFEGLS